MSSQSTPTRSWSRARTAAGAAAAVHLGAVLALLGARVVSGGVNLDRLGALPIAAVYGLPAVLVVLARRGRESLLLPAGIGALALAVLPFSLHSFVLGPAGLLYLAAHARWPDRRQKGSRSTAAAVAFPLLLLGAFLVLLVHEDPVCYTTHRSGEVTIDRDPGQVRSGSDAGGPDSDVVESGCTSDTVVWWEAAASLGLSTVAVMAAFVLVAPTTPREAERHDVTT